VLITLHHLYAPVEHSLATLASILPQLEALGTTLGRLWRCGSCNAYSVLCVIVQATRYVYI